MQRLVVQPLKRILIAALAPVLGHPLAEMKAAVLQALTPYLDFREVVTVTFTPPRDQVLLSLSVEWTCIGATHGEFFELTKEDFEQLNPPLEEIGRAVLEALRNSTRLNLSRHGPCEYRAWVDATTGCPPHASLLEAIEYARDKGTILEID